MTKPQNISPLTGGIMPGGDALCDGVGNLRAHSSLYEAIPSANFPRGVIPEALRLERPADLKPGEIGALTYAEDKLVEAFLRYAGEVHKAKGDGEFYIDIQALALARLMFLLEPSAMEKGGRLALQSCAAFGNGVKQLVADEKERQAAAAAKANPSWWTRMLGRD